MAGRTRLRAPRGPRWYQPARYLLPALALAGLMYVIRGIQPAGMAYSRTGSTMALGFLLLVAMLLGMLAETVRLPRITGYLLTGLVFGPEVLNLITGRNLAELSLISRFAIGVIAFTAGGELRPHLLRGRGWALTKVLSAELLAVLFFVGGALIVLRAYVPFLVGRDWLEVLALTFVFASIATVHSPAVTIALLNETKASGPVATTTLAVVVLADVAVVLLVSFALSGAHAVIGGGGFSVSYLLSVAWELVGAVLMGAVLGAAMAAYLRYVSGQLIFFVIFVIFFGYELSRALHVEFMLFMLSAGFFVENVSPVEGEPLLHAVEAVSGPAFALFFAVAGASIHLTELRLFWPIALTLVLVRAFALRTGTRVGASAAGMDPMVTRLLWRGLVSQAGVALGLVTVAARVLGEPGAAMLTLFLAMIAIHELVGPLLFRSALTAAGEIVPRGAAEPAPAVVAAKP